MNTGKISFLKQLIIYLIIVIGYLYVYFIPLDQVIHPEKKVPPSSKIEFVYQQY